MNADLKKMAEEFPRPFPVVRVMTVVDEKDPAWASRTSQEFKDAADINNIVATWTRSGVCPNVNVKEPLFVDCTQNKSFQDQLQSHIDAQNAFMTLDPKVRKQFDNSYVNLMDFLAKEENRDEAIRLGLIDKVDDVNQASAVAPQGKQVGDALDEKKGA